MTGSRGMCRASSEAEREPPRPLRGRPPRPREEGARRGAGVRAGARFRVEAIPRNFDAARPEPPRGPYHRLTKRR